jgi:2-polyprenyl-3-methyl-5-hydroxy-6-metoxy-1,4-benzoquinol methylase
MNNILDFTLIEGIKCFSPEVASAYDDYPDGGFDVTDEYAETSFWVSARSRLFKALVKKNLPPSQQAKFLEIGCGTGDFIKHLRNDTKLEITGSEVYLKGLVYAKKNQPDVEFIQFDVTKGQIGREFDMIVAFDVIEHIDNDMAALSNINRMLGSNGVAIISVPQHMFLWGPLDDIVKHKRRYSRGELKQKMEASGFRVRYTTSFVFFLFPLMLAARMFDKKRDDADSDQNALSKRVKFSPVLNRIMGLFMRIDEFLVKLGISLPSGGTLIMVAEKRNAATL